MHYLFEPYYKYDRMIWLRTLKKYKQKDFYLLKEQIINSKNSSFAYFYAKEFGEDIQKLCDIVIKNKDYKYIYLFAKNIPGVNLKKLENIVLKSDKISTIVNFACFIAGCNHRKFQQAIINSKNIKSYYLYIKYGNIKDISPFKELIFASKKPRYVYELARHLSCNKDIKRAEKIILNSNSFIYLKLFPQYILGANLKAFEAEIIKRNDKDEILKFVKAIKNTRLRKMISFF